MGLIILIIVMSFSQGAFARDLKIMEVIGDYPRPDKSSSQNTIIFDFLRASEGLKKGQPLTVEVAIRNVPTDKTASMQWVQDGVPLENGYYSSIVLSEGMTVTYDGVLPYYGDGGTATNIGLDVAVDGVLRREVISVPFVDGNYLDEAALRLMEYVRQVDIDAWINTPTNTYMDRKLSAQAGYLNAGTFVYYRDHEEEDSACVQLSDGSTVWVPYKTVTVSGKNFTVQDTLTDAEKEKFVNAMGYASKTPYLIWIHPRMQKVNVFMGEQGKWVLQKSFTCSTGANQTPTPAGSYEYCARDKAWIKPEYQVRPILYFNIYRGLAFHSRLYSPDGSRLIDGTIGRPASHGCVRMYDDDIAWLELYMTFGTKVIVY
ncbi:MAG: L,D-transpeptidase [Clostridia bacterium]|nr:L,D-transpeptidase [Clostridia bacterium]